MIINKKKYYVATCKVFYVVILLCFASNDVSSQTNKKNDLKNKIETINEKVCDAFTKKNIAIIMSYFHENAVSMPEFQKTMRGNSAIKEYYIEILKRHQIISFKKNISETILLKRSIAEIGTFTITYENTEAKNTSLNGKYLNIWSVQKSGNLLLKAESFGYFHAIEKPTNYIVKLPKEISNNTFIEPSQTSNALSFQLKALNSLMEKSVKMRDGKIRADFFSDDAIFMPFADSLQTGIKSIRKHLIEYNSYPVSIDSINIDTDYFEDCDKYIIEYPTFYVKWHTKDSSGIGSGKGIRIWRREKDCSLKIYREIGIHDHLD